MNIEIDTVAQLASISGGDAGPGTGDSEGLGNNYKWSLTIEQMYPVPDEDRRAIILNTLNSVMQVIANVAQTTSQSVSISGAGAYDGVNFSFGGSSKLSVSLGQLQSHGSQIDLSTVNDPGFASLNSLPHGTFKASPSTLNGTTWDLVITIK